VVDRGDVKRAALGHFRNGRVVHIRRVFE
jgi:hypothetical protein